MRILLLSDVNSIHTKRWATALRQKGIEVGLFSLTRPAGTGDAYLDIEVFSHGIPDKFLEGLTLGNYTFDKFKKEKDKSKNLSVLRRTPAAFPSA